MSRLTVWMVEEIHTAGFQNRVLLFDTEKAAILYLMEQSEADKFGSYEPLNIRGLLDGSCRTLQSAHPEAQSFKYFFITPKTVGPHARGVCE